MKLISKILIFLGIYGKCIIKDGRIFISGFSKQKFFDNEDVDIITKTIEWKLYLMNIYIVFFLVLNVVQ